MRQLPERPDLDQLRRQAKELHRAASADNPSAVRRPRRVSTSTRLSAARLALAREYGFSSWARLKAEVERRRVASRQTRTTAAPTELRSWSGMRGWMASLLQRRTGQDVEAWNRRIKAARVRDQAALRRWLNDQGVTGYAQRLLVWERFGYPSFMKAGIGDLIGRQYADRPKLRPVLAAILGVQPGLDRPAAKPTSRWSPGGGRSPSSRPPPRAGSTSGFGWRTRKLRGGWNRPAVWATAP